MESPWSTSTTTLVAASDHSLGSRDYINGGTSYAYQAKTAKHRAGQSQGYVNDGASHLYEKSSHTRPATAKESHQISSDSESTDSSTTGKSRDVSTDFYSESNAHKHRERSENSTPDVRSERSHNPTPDVRSERSRSATPDTFSERSHNVTPESMVTVLSPRSQLTSVENTELPDDYVIHL